MSDELSFNAMDCWGMFHDNFDCGRIEARQYGQLRSRPRAIHE